MSTIQTLISHFDFQGNTNSMAKQKWEVGSIFLIKIDSGERVVCQILSDETEDIGAVGVALSNIKLDSCNDAHEICNLKEEDIFSVLFTFPAEIRSGHWKVIGACDVALDKNRFPFEDLRDDGYVGASIDDENLVEYFVNAFFAQRPWDGLHDSDTLDRMLIDRARKPKKLILKNI